MKTFSQKAGDVTRSWFIVDASAAPLGRLSTQIASRLIGKYKPSYTPHIDAGDYVVVINADKLVVTGNKEDAKTYYRYSGFPGGMKSRTLGESRSLDSTKVIVAAVKGMLPRNKLAAERLKRLRVFPGETHTHEPQKPMKLEV